MNFKNFHIGIKAVIVEHGKVLVLRGFLSDGRMSHDLPGGRLNEGEGIKEGLTRELKEELDLDDFVLKDLLFAVEKKNYNKNGSSLIYLFYKVDAKISEVKLSKEHVEHRWIMKGDLDEIVKNKEHVNDGLIEVLEKVL